MRKYYLIVRYTDTNTIQVVELNTKWYDKNRENVSFRANYLEAIDLVTTRFKTKEEMILRMCDNGYIFSTDVDVFIATKGKNSANNDLRIYEIIYNANNAKEISEFRDIARASINNNIELELLKIRNIFDKLANKIFYDQEFSLYLRSGFTNIYNRVVEIYSSLERRGSLYEIKYDNYWMLKSYTLIRNIVEAISRFDCKSEVVLSRNSFSEIEFERNKVRKDILIKIDENYIDGQLSLFDDENIDHMPRKKESEANIFEDNVVDNVSLSIDEKKSFILKLIDDLPVDIFRREGNSFMIDTSFFRIYANDGYKSKLKNLSSKIASLLFYYTLHYEKYRESLVYNQNTFVWEEELRKDKNKIYKFLSKNKNIEMIYNWCTIYLECLKFEREIFCNDGVLEDEKVRVKR